MRRGIGRSLPASRLRQCRNTREDSTKPDGTNHDKHTKAYGAVFQCDYMQGLWLLVHRQGTRILVRYESQLLPELLIEMRVEPIGAGH